eukprot:15456872-Alexandrium_andersonii.AAC.1
MPGGGSGRPLPGIALKPSPKGAKPCQEQVRASHGPAGIVALLLSGQGHSRVRSRFGPVVALN